MRHFHMVLYKGIIMCYPHPHVDGVITTSPLFSVTSCCTSFFSVARREGRAAKMRLANLTNKYQEIVSLYRHTDSYFTSKSVLMLSISTIV